MEQSITSLSPEQAQHALMIFYDLVPDDFWEGGQKPSAAKIKFTAEQLQEDAPEDVQPFVNALLAKGAKRKKERRRKPCSAYSIRRNRCAPLSSRQQSRRGSRIWPQVLASGIRMASDAGN